jgi:phenylalanyl-tRNA synthetase beta chain
MLISYNWIKDFTTVNDSPNKLAEKLTMAGIEVSSIEKIKDDFVFNAEITPNRPDLLSIKGIAREVSCLSQTDLKDPLETPQKSRSLDKGISAEVREPEACSRYNATLIKNTKIKVSDAKITRRLSALDLRPVNSVVDITNYFLLGWGQPLHAFDYDKIDGKKIIVRYAKKGEKLSALDGKEYTLDPSILVIADAKKPIAIAGLIGGIETEIGLETKNVLLECASFDPVSIRKASRKLGISTDSSYRFERGVASYNIEELSLKAAFFIQQAADGKITDNLDICNFKPKKVSSLLRLCEIERILGIKIPQDEVKRILISLGFDVEKEEEGVMEVASPYFRDDVSREIDLIEEIARIYGYEKIPSTIAKLSPNQIENYRCLSGSVAEDSRFKIKMKIRDRMCACGLNEIISYSMIGEDEIKAFNCKTDKVIKLQKALSSQQEIMRPTLLSGILQAISWNTNRQIDDIGLFEMGDVFLNENHKFSEKLNLGFAVCGKKYIHDWHFKPQEINFYDLKGVLEDLFDFLGIEGIGFARAKVTYFIKSQSAKVTYKDKTIARFGKIDSKLLSIYNIDNDVYAAEVYLEDILADINLEKQFVPIAKFPAVNRDLAVIVKNNLPAEDIMNEIKKVGKDLIQEIKLFDVYEGKQIPSGYLSLAFSIKYQAEDRTLTDEEVDEIQTQIQRVLVENLRAQIR